MFLPRLSLLSCALLFLSGCATAADQTPLVSAAAFAPHIAKFNTMEPETVVNAVPNAEAQAWLEANVPRFACPDAQLEETYWFRWWALRKHLRRDAGTGRWVFTEFITRERPVSSALGHHLMEGRWLRNQAWHDDYVRFWLRGKDGQPEERFHRYSQWLHHALWSRWLVTQDTATLTGLLDELVADYRRWETERMRPDGLFWQADVWDAMEESISGGRKVKNVRPTISVYMFGNATALAEIARRAGRTELAEEFAAKAAHLRSLAQKTLWNPELQFFGSVTEELQPIAVREAIGFIPWYFHLPETGRGYEVAWKQLTDEKGFKAPWGLTTAERRHPKFRTHGTGTCEWDGAVWPFATSQTLTALGNVLRDYPQNAVTNRDWFDAFVTYTRSHVYDGLPYLGEYQDESTGAWLKGRDPRSFYYNHSTYADLLITGLAGLRPRADNVIEVAPLLPEGTWDWFCLENVRYHGRDVTILWDKDGQRFGRGAGLQVIVDGQVVAKAAKLQRVTGKLP
ncbi:glycoside hydrolase [Oleiharenicola lentus]|uniref:Glycoside hydrolase n=1 Tax=Oleiharenicola lentus TaxID=2508720 RepID=A0A4Q1C600_9BACT|nr:glycosyl hydrolase family 65 protein [Oleiharenicola lentus]RXK53904.1 glycoside hydrolase [Oleiharenicola lentus]